MYSCLVSLYNSLASVIVSCMRSWSLPVMANKTVTFVFMVFHWMKVVVNRLRKAMFH